MSTWALWLIMLLIVLSGAATDVPFVFSEKTTSAARLGSDEIQKVSASSPELVGVPFTSTPQDNDTLRFPITGGSNTPVVSTEKKTEDLKKTLNSKVDAENDSVVDEARLAAGKYSGDYTIEQVSAIYDYVKENWHYFRDTRGVDYFSKASESLMLGKRNGCVGVGDCDDFAILVSALVEAAGGTTRIILARNNSTGGHAYAEVYIGQDNSPDSEVEKIISWLTHEYETDKIYTHIDTDTKDVWLDLDWGPDEKGNMHPGGPFYQGDKHYIICIRDAFGKTPLKLPEKTNKIPKLTRLVPDKDSPQVSGSYIAWTAQANDPDNDPIYFKFFLNDNPVTAWIKENTWTWKTNDTFLGENEVGVQVRDGKHALVNRFDDRKTYNFNISESKPIHNVPSNQPPIIKSLSADRPSPYEAGASINWTVAATDPESDQISYRFYLDDQPVTSWQSQNQWIWITSEANAGANHIEVRIVDGKHAGSDSFDANCSAEFTLTAPNHIPVVSVLSSDKQSPQEAGTAIVWMAKADDPENDTLAYRFLLNSNTVSNWSSNDKWFWSTDSDNVGENQIEVQLRDGKHAGSDNFDSHKTVGFTIIAPTIKGIESIVSGFNNSQSWIEQGNVFASRGKNDEAINNYDRVIEINPDYADAWINKGNALHKQSKYDEANKCFDEAISLDPSNAEAWVKKYNNIQYYMGRDNATTEDCLNNASRICDQDIRFDSNNASNWIDKGDLLFYSGDYEEAIKCYEKAVKLDHNNSVGWIGEGDALFYQRKYNEAIKCFTEAINRNPKDPYIWMKKGDALSNLNNTEEAINCYDKAIQIDSENAIAWLYKGELLFEDEKLEAGFKCLDEAARLAPKNADIWILRGCYLNKQGKFSEASKSFDRAIELYPQYAGVSLAESARHQKKEALKGIKIIQEGLETAALTKVLKIPLNPIESAKFGPDSNILALGTENGSIHLWNILDGNEIRILTGHEGRVNSLDFSPDGRMLASCGSDNTVKIWDTSSGMELKTLDNDFYAGIKYSVAFSPDGRLLASGESGGKVKLWDISSGNMLRTSYQSEIISSLAFSPDSSMLASGSHDGTIKLWDVSSGNELRTLVHGKWVYCVAFSPDGRELASGGDDCNVKLWDVSSGRELWAAGGGSWKQSVAFRPDGNTLASGSDAFNNKIQLWDVSNGTELRDLAGQSDDILSLDFSRDGKTLESISFNGTICVWMFSSPLA
ncbi:MAG: tetratricopeptide repeat protein [Methanothrix sp.]|nr:tetratricopeptide repeat protein [Methanothrix sp.]